MSRVLTRRNFLAQSLLATTSIVGMGLMSPLASAAQQSAVSPTPAPGALSGEVPLLIEIPDAAVSAEVEKSRIVDGQMADPSGPWVVAWYEETGGIGADLKNHNTVFAGHVDYWGVGPSVFQNVASLQLGSVIQITGEDEVVLTYEVSKNFLIPASPSEEQLRSALAPRGTHAPMITLITCGGEFDQAEGEYLSRTIVQALLVTD